MSALFFVNGALLANWVPRIPDVKDALGLSNGALGFALLGVGLGGLLGSLAAGPLDTRFGSSAMSVVGAGALCALLVLPGVAVSWATLLIALLAVGAADAVMDVSMNAHAVLVQRDYGRSIINAFHGLWSIGAVAGSLTGSLAASRQVPVAVHLGIVAVVGAVVSIGTARWLVPTPVDADAVRDDREAPRAERARRRGWVAPTGVVGALGLIALLGGVIEDSPGSWSAVYLRDTLGASPGAAGLAYAAFTAAMTVGRLFGDRMTQRFGAVRVLRGGTLLGACGLAAGLVLATPAAAIVGFGLVGLGVATLFPLVFAAAGSLPGIPSGGGIGTVSLIARWGFMVGPPAIGLIAEAVGLEAALGVVVVACATIAASVGAVTRKVAGAW